MELIHAILHEEPTALRKYDPRIPQDLETIVLKAMAKNPRAIDFRGRGSSWLPNWVDSEKAGRSNRGGFPVPERLWRWSRRNRMVAVLVLLAATLSTALAIGSTAAAWKFRQQRDAVAIAQTKTRSEARPVALLLGARGGLRYSSQPGRRSDALESLRTAAGIAHEVGAGAEHLAELLRRRRSPPWPWPTTGRCTLPLDGAKRNGRRHDGVRRPCRRGTSFLTRTAQYTFIDYRDHSLIRSRAWGPGRTTARSGPRLVPERAVPLGRIRRSADVELWDLDSGEMPAAWPADVRCACVSRARMVRRQRRCDQMARLCVYDLPGVALASRCRLGFEVPGRLAASSMAQAEDGRRLALVRPGELLASVYEVGSGRVVRDLKLSPIHVSTALALSRNGRFVAIVVGRTISVYDLTDGEQIALLQGHQAEVSKVLFQPGGDLLASQAWDDTTRVWDPIRGRLRLTLQGELHGWEKSGLGLAIGRDRDLVLHQIDSSAQRRTIDCRMLDDRARAARSGPWRIAYSPDGQLIAMGMRPGCADRPLSDGRDWACI